jgi:hypothetical protein
VNVTIRAAPNDEAATLAGALKTAAGQLCLCSAARGWGMVQKIDASFAVEKSFWNLRINK